MSKYGFIYLLKSYEKDNIFKIGSTTRSPSKRVEEINSMNPNSLGFDLLCYAEFQDPMKVERFLHKHLEKFRIPSTELFEGSLVVFASYLYRHQDHMTFCECGLLAELLCPIEALPDPYEEMNYVF